jgi:hypothetical protein
MNKPGNIIWDIPFYFFIFLGLFISIKFVFIFFFRAAFEPQFIFELTPFYIFSGVSSLQLLFLSLIIVGYDTYLHMQPTRKNILRSFIPTALMLCGLGLGITTKEISFSYLANYLLFGLLLFIIIVDHRRTLVFPEMLPPKAPPKPLSLLSRMKLPFFTKPKPQKASPTTKSRLSFSAVSSIFSIFKRGKKSVGVSGKGRESTSEHKTTPSKAQQKEVLPEKSKGKEKSEVDQPPQKFESQKVPPSVGGQGGMGGGGTRSMPGGGAAIPQSTSKTVGTAPYYKDQTPSLTKPKFSPTIIKTIFGKRKKIREPERRNLIPVKPHAPSGSEEEIKETQRGKAEVVAKIEKQKGLGAQKIETQPSSLILENQKEKIMKQDQEPLPVFKEKPSDEEHSFHKLKKEEKEETVFPMVAEGTETAEKSEQQKILKEELKVPIVPKQEVDFSEEELYKQKKEIEGKITVFKDLQSNYENIQRGLDSLKNELENICNDIQLTDQKPMVSKSESPKKEVKEEFMKETIISPYLRDTKKITKPMPYSIKLKMAEKRKRDIQRAKTILNKLEGKVENLERIYI